MGRAVLEDLTGEINLIIFPKAYASGLNEQLKSDTVVTVEGKLKFSTDFRGDADSPAKPELFVDDILPMDKAVNRFARSLTIQFSTVGLEESLLEELKAVLKAHPGPIPVWLRVETPGHEQTLIETEENVNLHDPLFEQLGKLLGEKAWKIESASS